jgi:hypothetical protein
MLLPLNPIDFLLFLFIAVVPAYYFQKWATRIAKPRQSLKRFFLFVLLNLGFAFLYTAVFITIVLFIYPIPKQQ